MYNVKQPIIHSRVEIALVAGKEILYLCSLSQASKGTDVGG